MIYFQLPWCKCQKKKPELQIQFFLQYTSYNNKDTSSDERLDIPNLGHSLSC